MSEWRIRFTKTDWNSAIRGIGAGILIGGYMSYGLGWQIYSHIVIGTWVICVGHFINGKLDHGAENR